MTPHVARRTHSAIDGRNTRYASYRASQKIRKRVEEVFGWMKTVGGLRRTRYRVVERTGLAGYFLATAYNLVRMANLMAYERARAVQSVCPTLGALLDQRSDRAYHSLLITSWGPVAHDHKPPFPARQRSHRPIPTCTPTGKNRSSAAC